MASMYCWPSISIKHGVSLVFARKVVKVEFKCTFDYLLIVIDIFFEQESCMCHHFKEQSAYKKLYCVMF